MTDKGDVLDEKNYLHERTIDVRALLSSAFVMTLMLTDEPHSKRPRLPQIYWKLNFTERF